MYRASFAGGSADSTYQVAARVGTMSALVRLGSRVRAQVPPQVGTDVAAKVAAGVAATVGPLDVYAILVPHPVPARN